MTGIAFETVDVPKVTRNAEPNPYVDAVAGIAGTDKALAFVIPGAVSALNEKGNETNKEIAKALRLLGLAGAELEKPVTVRKRVDAVMEGKKQTGVKVTFWTTDRITHKDSKAAKAAAEAEATA